MNTVQHPMTHFPTTRPRGGGPHPRATLYPPSSTLSPRSAFTLVELMVSVAMVVLLLVGIHQVFRMSSNTIGTGQAVVAVNREVRAAQTVMQEDFRRSLKDSPLFVIHSAPVAAQVRPEAFLPGDNFIPRLAAGVSPFHFNTLAERDRDIDGDPATIDRDGDGSEETSYSTRNLARVNDRLHRSDIVGFFARGLFTRQTADDGLFVSDTKAFDAWIWYGHVRLPDAATGAYLDPGAGAAGTPNLFAGNWVLGRRAILLKDPRGIDGESYINFPTGSIYTGPLAYDSPITNVGRGATLDVRPAAGGSATSRKGSTVHQSRLDLAGMSLETYRADLRTQYGLASWFNPLIFRYECDPRVRKPINASNLAKTTPYFVGNVSQFLVEFAGDFITQNNDINDDEYGLVTDSVPDGVIDFVVLDPDVRLQTSKPSSGSPRVRKTRWYGLPRDSNGDGMTTAVMEYGDGGANVMPDVVPVWDVIRSAFPTANPLDFEMWSPQQATIGRAPKNKGADGYGSLSAPNDFRYICAWTDSAPAMLRIVMKLEDPAGRLADGHWVEFVLDSP